LTPNAAASFGKVPVTRADFVFCRYVVIPIYLGLFLFWKLYKKTKFVKASEADLWTGKAALDAEVWPEQIPRNFIERIWFWIA
jgi:amino acid transporter